MNAVNEIAKFNSLSCNVSFEPIYEPPHTNAFAFNDTSIQPLSEIKKLFEQYTPEDTLFCEFILDGSKAGTASAYRTIDKAIKFVRSTYSNLYYSETDISIVED